MNTSIGTPVSDAVGTSISIAPAEDDQKTAEVHRASIAVTRVRAHRCLILMFLFLPLSQFLMLTCGQWHNEKRTR